MKYTADFERVYEHYPWKKGKFQAQKTWNKLNDTGGLPSEEVMIKAIETQKKERAFFKSQNRFVPEWKHFSTWLNAACFDDECETQVARTEPKRTGGNGIGNMQSALNILTNVSEEKFNEFCEAVGMPAGDKEAVLNRYSGKFDVKSLSQGLLKGVE